MDQIKQERSQPERFQPKRCFWCFDQPQGPYFQPPHFFQSACWLFQDTLRRRLILERQGKLYFRDEIEPIQFTPGQPRQERVYSHLVQVGTIEARQRIRRPVIADLGMAGSTVKLEDELSFPWKGGRMWQG
jgi:hypothetical protein